MYEVEVAFSAQNGLGEGPIWSAVEQKLYWVDITGSCFYTMDPATAETNRFDVGLGIGSLALNRPGGLIMATTAGFGWWDNTTEQLSLLKNNIAYQPPQRFNDGAVDRAGRFWAGTASDDPVNKLYRLDPDGSVQIMETGIYISNGISWSPDNKTMYYSDSGGGGIVYAYDFDLPTGSISRRRAFLPPTQTGAVADGLTVDSDGFVWCAFWDGWRIARYDPDGRLVREIPMPVQRPTSCMFGGPNLDVLYITSASIDLTDAEKKQQPHAGSLFRIQTDVKGLPEPQANFDPSMLEK